MLTSGFFQKMKVAKEYGRIELQNPINEKESQIASIIEKLQKGDLRFFEEAEEYCCLLNEFGFTQERLASKLGKSQSTIANKVRLLKLPSAIKKHLIDNELTERHARALLKLSEEKLQMNVLKFVSDKDLNVKKTEYLIERIIDKYSKSNGSKFGENKFVNIVKKDMGKFVSTIKEGIENLKKVGINAKAAQMDRGDFFEFIVRIPKEAN